MYICSLCETVTQCLLFLIFAHVSPSALRDNYMTQLTKCLYFRVFHLMVCQISIVNIRSLCWQYPVSALPTAVSLMDT